MRRVIQALDALNVPEANRPNLTVPDMVSPSRAPKNFNFIGIGSSIFVDHAMAAALISKSCIGPLPFLPAISPTGTPPSFPNFSVAWLCCTNGVGDSLFESSGVATVHEQLVPYEVQDQELAFVQHGAEAARFAINLV